MKLTNVNWVRLVLPAVPVLGILLSLWTTPSGAQTIHTGAKGNNAVWSDATDIIGSSAFIDARAWATGGDFCAIVGQAIAVAPATGAVVDARGINSSNSTLACAHSPWNGIATPAPVTLLLPPGTLAISETWTLPNRTQVIGEGRLNTIIQPATGFSGDLIDMGSASCPTGGCSAVSIQHLQLGFPGSSPALNTNNGIVNAFAQTGSYVDDVSLSNLGGVALSVSASDSGPYTNINYGTDQPLGGSCSGTGINVCPVCVRFTAPTRGLRGVTCSGDTQTAGQKSPNAAAIQIQSGGNSIQDIHLEAFWDGIQIGSSSAAINGVTVANVSSANNGGGGGFVSNTVHICGSNENAPTIFFACPSTLTQPVSDVSILSVTNCNGVDAATVQDDVSGTTIAPTANKNGTTGCNYVGSGSPANGTGGPGGAYVAMYNLGESVSGAGFTRFNSTIAAYTTPNVNQNLFFNTMMPVWGVGDVAPSNNPNTPLCQPGSLFSNTSGAHSLYVCVGGTGASSGWKPVTAN